MARTCIHDIVKQDESAMDVYAQLKILEDALEESGWKKGGGSTNNKNRLIAKGMVIDGPEIALSCRTRFVLGLNTNAKKLRNIPYFSTSIVLAEIWNTLFADKHTVEDKIARLIQKGQHLYDTRAYESSYLSYCKAIVLQRQAFGKQDDNYKQLIRCRTLSALASSERDLEGLKNVIKMSKINQDITEIYSLSCFAITRVLTSMGNTYDIRAFNTVLLSWNAVAKHASEVNVNTLPENMSYTQTAVLDSWNNMKKLYAFPLGTGVTRVDTISTGMFAPITNDKIPGIDDIYCVNKRIIGFLEEAKNCKRLQEEFPELPVSRNVLLYGPPGTGKTTIAQAVAKELLYPFCRVNCDSLLSSEFSKSLSKIRNIYDSAVQESNVWSKPVIIFLDEIDTLIPSRKDSVEPENNKIVTTMLQCLDERLDSKYANVITIATTNLRTSIDKAALDRFSCQAEVGLPDCEHVYKIVNKIMGNKLKLANVSEEDQRIISVFSQGLSLRSLSSALREARLGTISYAKILKAVLEQHRSNQEIDYYKMSSERSSKITISNFDQRFSSGCLCEFFSSLKRLWALVLQKDRAYVMLFKGNSGTFTVDIVFDEGGEILASSSNKTEFNQDDPITIKLHKQIADQLNYKAYQLLDIDGCMHITVFITENCSNVWTYPAKN